MSLIDIEYKGQLDQAAFETEVRSAFPSLEGRKIKFVPNIEGKSYVRIKTDDITQDQIKSILGKHVTESLPENTVTAPVPGAPAQPAYKPPKEIEPLMAAFSMLMAPQLQALEEKVLSICYTEREKCRGFLVEQKEESTKGKLEAVEMLDGFRAKMEKQRLEDAKNIDEIKRDVSSLNVFKQAVAKAAKGE